MERFVPGQRVAPSGPLAAYRQPLPEDLLIEYVDLLSSPGELVIAPFAQSDVLARVASARGRRSVSAHANPLVSLLIRVAATPAPADAVSALQQQVADAPHHAMTTRQHLLDLYRSRCPSCGWELSADYLVWSREQNAPLAKGLICPSCGHAGESPVDDEDLTLAAGHETRALAYWRVLNRLATRDEPIYGRAQSLLDLYTGRNLYALHHLTTRIEAGRIDLGAEMAGDTRAAILLECLDSGASLDSPTRSRRMARPGAPARFVERNVWRLFESACTHARARAGRPAIPVAPLKLPLERTIISTANAAQLARIIPDDRADLIISAPPAPWPAFWALSYMWTAWIMGRQPAANLAHWLKRHQVDWDWYVEVMAVALSSLARLLHADGHIVLAWQPEHARWVEAILLAAGQAELTLAGLTCQCQTPWDADAGPATEYRIVLTPKTPRVAPLAGSRSSVDLLETGIRRAGKEAAFATLAARAEPTPGAVVHAGVYRRLVEEGLLGPGSAIRQQPAILHFVENTTWRDAIEDKGIRLLDAAPSEEPPAAPTHPDLEPALWWTDVALVGELSLTDRVETYVRRLLEELPAQSRDHIARAVYEHFPGLLTPDEGVIAACIAAYARQGESGGWSLRAEDEPVRRQADLAATVESLQQLGERLEMAVKCGPAQDPSLRPTDLLWTPAAGRPFLFRVVSDTLTAHLECDAELVALQPRCYIVLPGGRSSLARFRQRERPLWLAAASAHDWRFIKYRHIRRLGREGKLDMDGLLRILELDPIVDHDKAQLPLL